MDKKTFLKISGHRSMKSFYSEFPDEASFMLKHGKEFRKAMRGDKIKKAEAGFNTMNAGTNSQMDAESQIAGASSLMQTKQKKSVGNQIEGVVKDIPVLGGLVSGIVGLFDERKERMRQQRAAKLSSLTLQASESAPRRQPNKYLRPDMDAQVNDINSLMPAEGTGTNLLARYGGEVPQSSFGSILGSVLGSSGGSGGGSSSGLLGSVLGGVLGGGSKEEEKKPELSKIMAMNSISGAAGDIRVKGMPNLGRERLPQQGLVVPNIMMGQFQDGGTLRAGLTSNFINSSQYKKIGSQNQFIADAASYSTPKSIGIESQYIQKAPSQMTKIENVSPTQPGSLTTNSIHRRNEIKQNVSDLFSQGSSTNQGNEKSVGTGPINMMAIEGLNNAGGRLGNYVGSTVGSVFGPAGQIVGGVVGSLAGLVDAAGRKMAKAQGVIRRNQNRMLASQIGNATQQLYSGNMRTGGQLRKNSSDMENRGELNTLWGGHAEPLSYNPYLPDGGETVMFRGASHDESNGRGDTGIGVHYGDGLAPYEPNVEVEGGEPAVQLPDETGENNLVVFGNLPIPKQYVNLIGDKDAKGKKFKGYVAALSKKEQKENKIVAKATEELASLNPKNTFDKLKADTLSLIIKGADTKQQKYAGFKQKAADLQQAINDTAEEYGVEPESLLKGKMKAAKGANVPKAQNGITEERKKALKEAGYSDDFINRLSKEKTGPLASFKHIAQTKGMLDYTNPDEAGKIFAGENYEKVWKPKVHRAFSNRAIAEEIVRNIENYTGQDADDVKAILAKEKTMDAKIKRAEELATDGRVGPYHQIVNRYIDDINNFRAPSLPATIPLNIPQREIKPLEKPSAAPEKEKPNIPQFPNMFGIYLPSNVEGLDPRQLTGEYYALATNQLEPVPAQLYHPNLRTPYEISMQDILNENTASMRGLQRLSAYNPAAQAMLASGLYDANTKVLGEQFRQNQAFKDKIYGENTNILNDAQLKNLDIMDRQYVRQAQALSRTKDVAREALSSISDKYMQNQLANRTLATYENLYNYRYDPNYHAWNMNWPAQWNMEGSGQGDYMIGGDGQKLYPQYRNGKLVGYLPEDRATTTTEETTTKYPKSKGRNGAILKAMKSL